MIDLTSEPPCLLKTELPELKLPYDICKDGWIHFES